MSAKHLWHADGSDARCVKCGLRSIVQKREPRAGVRARYPEGHRVKSRVYLVRGVWVRKPTPCPEPTP